MSIYTLNEYIRVYQIYLKQIYIYVILSKYIYLKVKHTYHTGYVYIHAHTSNNLPFTDEDSETEVQRHEITA